MGRWVVYFSLAALPLFGLGQALIPAADEGRRRYAFWLMTVYVACGLGLLLTTTLLGLRRYLRRRRLQMPIAMTGLWLGLGAALIACFLLAGIFLPRPDAEYALIRVRPVGAADRDASGRAMRSNAAGKGEGRGGAEGKDKNAQDGNGGKGQSGGKAAGKSGKPEGKGGDRAGGRGKSDREAKDGGRGDDQSKNGKSGDDREDKQRTDDRSNAGDTVRRTNEQDRSQNSESSSSDSPSPPPSPLAALMNVVKWIVLAILAILAALFVLWFVARHLASVSDWARQLFEALSAFWRSLFGGSAPVRDDVEEDVAVVQERPRPFADFRNPFADGSAAGRSPDELVRYSFTALEAWAFEQDQPRRPDETPLEFADRVGAAVPALEADARRLTGLYARLAYARRRLPEAARGQIEAFWQALDAQASGVA